MNKPRIVQDHRLPEPPVLPEALERLEKRKRLAIFALLLGIIVFVVLLFWPFVMANIILPLSMVAWLLLRVFVLSIGQEYYWWGLIILAFIWIAHRFIGGQAVAEEIPRADPNTAMQSTERWRSIIHVAAGYSDLRRMLKRDLTQMLINLYASRRQDVNYTDVYEPMLRRQIPLPEPVYEFLFSPEPENPNPTFFQKLRALPQAQRRRWLRWTGQDVADYHRSIDAVLTFIENSLEVPHDDEPAARGND